MADRSLVIVNYHSAALCRDAVASARAASAEPLEVVVVDNSCDAAEAEALRGVGADEVIVAPENLGFATGVNVGVRAASGSKIVVSNPDVVFGAHCIDLLVEQLRGRVALTGPRLCWDVAGEWLLPPADVLTAGTMLSRIAARSSASLAVRRTRSLFARRLAFWRASDPLRVAAVSGAVMAIDRSALERVGGFDGRYRLYYEEIDLMRSLAREGFEVRYVPAAHCRHLYDQSATSAHEHQLKFAESEALYMSKWHGASARLLAAMEGGRDVARPPASPVSPSSPIQIPAPPAAHVVEVSPLESFDTAAGYFPTAGEARLPREIWEGFHGAALYARVVEASSGREISRGMMVKSK
ncbi:MAG: glycosyltransferase family 2 protein [Thermoanaerobaculia bacterium]|nr:glycosyltransferase family 2 protein [Thermoanaerobaculia bacterium]